MLDLDRIDLDLAGEGVRGEIQRNLLTGDSELRGGRVTVALEENAFQHVLLSTDVLERLNTAHETRRIRTNNAFERIEVVGNGRNRGRQSVRRQVDLNLLVRVNREIRELARTRTLELNTLENVGLSANGLEVSDILDKARAGITNRALESRHTLTDSREIRGLGDTRDSKDIASVRRTERALIGHRGGLDDLAIERRES